jgi:hypothetical protein
VTPAVTENTSLGRVVWQQRMPLFREHRLSLNGSGWDIRWLSGRGKTPTLCVFPVFSVAVMEECCDAGGDGEYYFRSIGWRYRVLVSREHRALLTGSGWEMRWLSGR